MTEKLPRREWRLLGGLLTFLFGAMSFVQGVNTPSFIPVGVWFMLLGIGVGMIAEKTISLFGSIGCLLGAALVIYAAIYDKNVTLLFYALAWFAGAALFAWIWRAKKPSDARTKSG